jgi:hypothetical protein
MYRGIYESLILITEKENCGDNQVVGCFTFNLLTKEYAWNDMQVS